MQYSIVWTDQYYLSIFLLINTIWKICFKYTQYFNEHICEYLWAHLQTAPSLRHRIASSRSAYTCDRYNNGSLKDVLVTYEYIILQGKKGFTNMVEVKGLQKARLFWITRGLNLIIWVLEIRRGRIERHRLPPENNSTSCSWFWRWRKETISQGVDDP